MNIRQLTPAYYLSVPWKNGGGISITIAGERLPGTPEGDWAGVVWQLGRTRIIAPAPFSDLSGFERMQIVVGGSGLVLETPTGEIDLRTPFTPVRYDGGIAITSRLENGPVEVVNLIARRDLCSIDLVMIGKGFGQNPEIALAPAHHVVYAPTETARIVLNGVEHLLAVNHAMAFDGAAEIISLGGVALVASVTKPGTF